MFATPSSYSVTPCKSNFARIPERASSIIRDVKRRSLRTCRSKTLPEKRLSGNNHHHHAAGVILGRLSSVECVATDNNVQISSADIHELPECRV